MFTEVSTRLVRSHLHLQNNCSNLLKFCAPKSQRSASTGISIHTTCSGAQLLVCPRLLPLFTLWLVFWLIVRLMAWVITFVWSFSYIDIFALNTETAKGVHSDYFQIRDGFFCMFESCFFFDTNQGKRVSPQKSTSQTNSCLKTNHFVLILVDGFPTLAPEKTRWATQRKWPFASIAEIPMRLSSSQDESTHE